LNNPQLSRTGPRPYLAVLCEKCQLPILFALDRSDESTDFQLHGAGRLVLTCTVANCRHRADYTMTAVFRLKAQPPQIDHYGRTNESRKNPKHAG